MVDFVLKIYFGVRKFDDGGRFLSIDPLWEKYYSLTPYHYCSNNPVNATDPSGLLIDFSKTDYYLQERYEKDFETAVSYLENNGAAEEAAKNT